MSGQVVSVYRVNRDRRTQVRAIDFEIDRLRRTGPPCPFCGSLGLYEGVLDYRKDIRAVCCRSCGAYGPAAFYTGDRDMIRLWSQRADKVDAPRGGFMGCPRCGKKDHVDVTWSWYKGKLWWVAVGCKRCALGGPQVGCADGDEHGKLAVKIATKKWNKRAA